MRAVTSATACVLFLARAAVAVAEDGAAAERASALAGSRELRKDDSKLLITVAIQTLQGCGASNAGGRVMPLWSKKLLCSE
jgi:hypothetical protein